ncbi:patatin [Spirosoma sp. HMF4905]|uniref:Patatin n=1 Tax=Spirosoma arboris TaxID=2682092 RepID=A0A7K1SK77_9BACT|nr:patatin-like phospholipase family protein [Spirosoma arboris]MVM34154.1 patatin [Spirosoma arboris]
MTQPSWGTLAYRYSIAQPQRKLLALDGGGIRGLITLQILLELESQLKTKLGRGDDFRLAEYFDYIAGTSTGAIIAAGLSLGFSVQKLIDFYLEKGEAMFDKAFLANWGHNLYSDQALLEELKATFGDGTDLFLNAGQFHSLLLVVTMNRTTDSPWPISNNPWAKYNDPNRPDCNLRIKLFQLVRASTAAPVYFPPEKLEWEAKNAKKTFEYVDGGMTPYNNPAFLLFRMATHPAYKLEWQTGEDNLLLVSVGTGASVTTGGYGNIIDTLKSLPDNLMYASLVDQDINCRTFGCCAYGAPIDRELGDLVLPEEAMANPDRAKRLFRYVRYNVDLSQDGLNALGLSTIKSDDVRQLDSVKFKDQLQLVGKTAAAAQVKIAHLGNFI